jgi:hypothetical protein
MTTLPVTIAAAGTLSNGVAMPGQIVGLYIPTITASIVYLRASLDGITFSRVILNDASGIDWQIPSSTGDRYIFLDNLAPFPFLMIECGSAQPNGATFTFILK